MRKDGRTFSRRNVFTWAELRYAIHAACEITISVSEALWHELCSLEVAISLPSTVSFVIDFFIVIIIIIIIISVIAAC